MQLSSVVPNQPDSNNITRESVRSVTWLGIFMCALTAIFYCYEYYLRVAPSVMSAELKATFLLSDAGFGYLAAFYYYAYTPMQIPVGMLLDRFGPRKVLTVACLLCALGTYLFASTPVVGVAAIGRFLVGFGSAFAYVGVLKISDVWLPQKYFALMAGIATALGMLGAIVGTISMSALVARMGWQSTLYYSVWAGLILTLILWIVLRDRNPNQTSIDNGSKQALAPRVNEVLQGLLKMCVNPQMWINGTIGCLTFLPITAFAELWVVPFLGVVGFSRSDAALGASMMFLGFALGGPCWGLLSNYWKSRRIPLILGSLLAAIFMLILILFPTTSKAWMYSLLFLVTLSASAEILVFAVSNDQNPKEVCATAAAFTNMFTMIGGALLPPIIGTLLDTAIELKEGLPVYSASDYTLALMAIPVGLVLAAILSFCLRESYHHKS